MPDSFGSTPTEKQIYDGLRRIGLRGGVGFGAATPEQILEALGATPDDAGVQVLLARLAEILRRDAAP